MRSLTKAILASALLVVGLAGPAAATIPLQLTWQGVALDSNDAPLATGLYTLHFSIYSDDVGGTLLWNESQSILVENGVMSVNLGKNNPVPDSAFASPMSFLEVQFEDQPPYTPRSRIVSVGYAYRTSSVDGAIGGTLIGDVIVEGGVSAPVLDVLDGAGNVTAHVGTSGEGGLVTIASDPSMNNGIVLEGDAGGSGEPRFAIVGTDGAIEFDLREGSNLSLLLPPDAVTANEILDEPGLASGFQAGVASGIGSAYSGIATSSANFPAAGFVLVMVESTLRGHTGNAPIEAQLLENNVVVAKWQWNASDSFEDSFNLQNFLFTTAVPAGVKTYTLQIRRSHGTVDAADSKIVAVYFPTNYGSVAATGGPTPYTLDGDLAPQYPAASALDVESQRDASLAENQARIERELDAMAERMVELRKLIKDSHSPIVVEP